jgi:hypothetical protein
MLTFSFAPAILHPPLEAVHYYWVMFAFVINIPIGAFSCYTAAYHLYLSSTAQTAIEHLQNKDKLTKDPLWRNPFDQGSIRKNLIAAGFGPSPWFWLPHFESHRVM